MKEEMAMAKSKEENGRPRANSFSNKLGKILHKKMHHESADQDKQPGQLSFFFWRKCR